MPQVLPTKPPTPVSLLHNVKHVEGVHQWHLLINKHCRAIRHHMAALCSTAALRDCHSILVSADADGDLRFSDKLQAAL